MATTLTHRGFSGGLAQPAAMCLAGYCQRTRTLIMGVLNVTPVLVSRTAGHFLDPQAAIAQARRLIAEGADILDVGAELTRPYGGAVRCIA